MDFYWEAPFKAQYPEMLTGGSEIQSDLPRAVLQDKADSELIQGPGLDSYPFKQTQKQYWFLSNN